MESVTKDVVDFLEKWAALQDLQKKLKTNLQSVNEEMESITRWDGLKYHPMQDLISNSPERSGFIEIKGKLIQFTIDESSQYLALDIIEDFIKID